MLLESIRAKKWDNIKEKTVQRAQCGENGGY